MCQWSQTPSRIPVRAIGTGKPLRILSNEIAKIAGRQSNAYSEKAERHSCEWRILFDREGSECWD